ncbi:hypothetical protein APHAL10511_001495 [Amanita phalloides]|nr:hypothetical protein APHAL10511_001495 [Amanita phalloides]
MKSAWQGTMVDWAAANSGAVAEEVDVSGYSDFLQEDNEIKGWEREDEQFVFKSSDSELNNEL